MSQESDNFKKLSEMYRQYHMFETMKAKADNGIMENLADQLMMKTEADINHQIWLMKQSCE